MTGPLGRFSSAGVAPDLAAADGTVATALTTPLSALDLLNTYAYLFVAAFVVTLLATPFVRRLAIRADVIDHPDDARKQHGYPVAYLGGVAVFLGVLVAICFSYFTGDAGTDGYRPVPIAIVVGMVAITFTGFADDVWGWDPRLKIAGQLVAAAALAIDEVGVHVVEGVCRPIIGLPDEVLFTILDFHVLNGHLYYWMGTALIAVFVLGGCNAANLIDGLDGLLSGVVGIIAIGLLVIGVLIGARDHAGGTKSLEKATAQAESIEAAVARYRQAQGRAPPTLAALVSEEHLPQLPVLPLGWEIRYHLATRAVEVVDHRADAATYIARVVNDEVRAYQSERGNTPAGFVELDRAGSFEGLPFLPRGYHFEYDAVLGQITPRLQGYGAMQYDADTGEVTLRPEGDEAHVIDPPDDVVAAIEFIDVGIARYRAAEGQPPAALATLVSSDEYLAHLPVLPLGWHVEYDGATGTVAPVDGRAAVANLLLRTVNERIVVFEKKTDEFPADFDVLEAARYLDNLPLVPGGYRLEYDADAERITPLPGGYRLRYDPNTGQVRPEGEDNSLALARIILCIALLGAVLGFLPYNFQPAAIFLGDCGSLLLGYLCVVIILMLGDRGETYFVFAGLIVFALPVMDTTLAIIRRKLAGTPLSAGDDQHLHHQLKRALGSVPRAVFALYGISTLFALVGISLVVLVSYGLRVRVIYAIALVLFSFIAVVAVKAGQHQKLRALESRRSRKAPGS